jgi:hypothetical protein
MNQRTIQVEQEVLKTFLRYGHLFYVIHKIRLE